LNQILKTVSQLAQNIRATFCCHMLHSEIHIQD